MSASDPGFSARVFASDALRVFCTRMSAAPRTLICMADIEIMELRAFEPRCIDCGETGPIETSWFAAMTWEEQHVCVAARIDADVVVAGSELRAAS